MRKLFFIIALLISATALSQSPPPLKLRSNDLFTQVDGFMAASKGFSFPAGTTNTLVGVGTRASLFWNTAESKLYVFDGVSWKLAGGGAIKLKSANTDISVALVGDSTVLTLNSGLNVNQIVKRTTGGRIPIFGTTEHIEGGTNLSRYTSGANFQFYIGANQRVGINNAGFFVSDADMKIIGTTGRIGALGLSTIITAPTVSGIAKLAIVDNNGNFSNINFTTDGTSGPATLTSTTLNIPQYTGGGGGSYLPLAGGTLTGAVSGTTFTASGGFFDTSDIRLKNLINLNLSASKIKKITYQFKNDNTGRVHVGYSAQQVRKYMPNAVRSSNGQLSVNYIEVLVQKVSELEVRVKKLENEQKKAN